MARKEVHTVPTDKGWANKAGNRTLSNHQKKDTAQRAGRKQAIERKAEHVIHKKAAPSARRTRTATTPVAARDNHASEPGAVLEGRRPGPT